MNKNSLLKALKKNNKKSVPMHMPGHKRNAHLLGSALPYSIDITEIDGFDNLHEMQGILKETADIAKSLYGSKKAFPLVNGSTCGILAGIYAMAPFGSNILVARNCHKSVFRSIELLGLHPDYITPECDEHGILGEISAESIRAALSKNNDASLVIITSPTYEGVVSKIDEISAVCHEFNVPLLVDSAHGAHFGFSPNFPESATLLGADLVVMSLHKTLPSLTQTALLHICSNRVSEQKIFDALSIFETSSPSYVLLASIDECLRFVKDHGKKLLDRLSLNLNTFYNKTRKLTNLSVKCYDDKTKIVIFTDNTNISGTKLAQILRQDFKIETEMSGTNFVLAMTSLCDSNVDLKKLSNALFKIDKKLKVRTKETKFVNLPPNEIADIPANAKAKEGVFVALEKAKGCEALEYLWSYPPGIPIVCPGEIVTDEIIKYVDNLEKSGIRIKATYGFKKGEIYVKK